MPYHWWITHVNKYAYKDSVKEINKVEDKNRKCT